MGACARAAHDAGGRGLGIIPDFLVGRERALESIEHVVVSNMHERKMLMFERSDAFVVLPGGVGTLEEAVELLSWRRLDLHRRQLLLDDEMDAASQNFQMALQVAYLEMAKEIDALLHEGHFATDTGERLTRRALASYAAAAMLMPYSVFAKAVETRRYDVEALCRQFGVSFEQGLADDAADVVFAEDAAMELVTGHENSSVMGGSVESAGRLSQRATASSTRCETLSFVKSNRGCAIVLM